MFLVNMDEGRIIEDDEIKMQVVQKYPYKKWLKKFVAFKKHKIYRKYYSTEKEPLKQG